MPSPVPSDSNAKCVARLIGWDVVEVEPGRVTFHQNWYSHLRYKVEGLLLAVMTALILAVNFAIFTKAPWVNDLQDLNGYVTAIGSFVAACFIGAAAVRRLTGTIALTADRSGIEVVQSCLGFRTVQRFRGKPSLSLIKTRQRRAKYYTYSLMISSLEPALADSRSTQTQILDRLLGRFSPSFQCYSLSGGREELEEVLRELVRATGNAPGTRGPARTRKRRKRKAR